jgi:hypothetical protein
MKQVLLFCIILLFTSCSIFAQLTGVYSLSKFNEQFICSFYFFESGSYLIVLSEEVSPDQIEATVFSYGMFSQNKNEITLIDKIHGYKMLLIKNNKELIVKKSFNWLINRHFIFQHTHISSMEIVIPKLEASTVLQERNTFKHLNKVLNTLYAGTYSDGGCYSILIQSNKRYKLAYKNIIISAGAWSRNGNELILVDATLKCPFYVMIDKNALISKILPGDEDEFGTTFYKKATAIPGQSVFSPF